MGNWGNIFLIDAFTANSSIACQTERGQPEQGRPERGQTERSQTELCQPERGRPERSQPAHDNHAWWHSPRVGRSEARAKCVYRLTYWGLRQTIRRWAGLGGIAEPGLHDFRRAFRLAQLQAGVPEKTIARLMGHTTTQLIARYARQTGQDLREHYRSPVDGME